MSKKPLGHLSEEVRIGDLLMHNRSLDGIYEIVSLEHPTAGPEHLELRLVQMGHFGYRDGSFDYRKSSLNRDFKEVYITGYHRDFARLASLLIQANVSGDISEIHELLLKVDL